MKKNKIVIGYILVIISAVIFGCMPLITRFIYRENINSFSLVFLRNLISIPMLAIAVKICGKSLKIEARALPSIAWIAIVGCCATPMLLYTSYTFIDTGVATVFHFIYPAIVMLLGFLFLKNKIKLVDLLSLAVCIMGICMFYTPGAKFSVTGSALAILSGVTYAIYVIGLAGFRYKAKISGFLFQFYGAIFCSVTAFAFCFFSGRLVLPTSIKAWALCALFALVFNVGAVVLFQLGTGYIGGERASVLSAFEPITSVVVGMAFLNESGNWRTALGTFLVVSATVMIAVFDMRKKNSEK